MAIIAVLVVLIVYAINIARRQSRNSERRTNANTIRSALESSYSSNRDYPDEGTGNLLTEVATTLQTSNHLASDFDGGDPSDENTRNCYVKISSSTYYLWIMPEPVAAPGTCDPAGPPAGAEDLSLND